MVIRFSCLRLTALLISDWIKFSFFALAFLTPSASAEDLNQQQFEQHFAVRQTVVASSCTFSVTLNDEEQVIDTSALDQVSLRNSWNRMENLVAKMEAELEQQYRIRLAHDGDLTTGEGYGKFTKRTYSVQARSAKLGELFALEYALKHSAPSQLIDRSSNANGVHVYFLKERRTFSVIAEWGFDRDNQPAIFIEPHYDKTPKGKHLELVLIHELAHNAEVRMGMDAYHPETWTLANQLGWLPFSNPSTGENGWMMSSSESPNHFYKLGKISGMWVRCNRNGQPVTDDGVVVERQIDARRLTARQMAEVARSRPATTYFSNPMEMVAEGLMLFRSDSKHRRQLLAANPGLYQILKEQDQAEIDHTYGQQAFIRNVDGVLVADNNAVRRQLSEFETVAIANAPQNNDVFLASADGSFTGE